MLRNTIEPLDRILEATEKLRHIVSARFQERGPARTRDATGIDQRVQNGVLVRVILVWRASTAGERMWKTEESP